MAYAVNSEVRFDLKFYGKLVIEGNIELSRLKKEGELKAEGQFGFSLTLSAKSTGKFMAVIYEVDYDFEARAEGSGYFSLGISLGLDDYKGLYLQPIVRHSGIKITLTFKAKFGSAERAILKNLLLSKREKQMLIKNIISMNRKSIKILLFVICCFSYSCSQNTNNKKSKSQVKTENKMIEEIEQNVNSFSFRPYYSVNFDNSGSGCQFEILVNDIPVFSKIGTQGSITSSAPINSCMLKSGKQKLTLRLYPNVGKENINVSYKNNSPFNLSISYRKDAWDNDNLDEITVFHLPSIPLPEKGLSYFEKEIEFETKIPYEFEGWSNSKDLTKIPDIEEKVFNKYREILKILADKNYSAFAKMKNQKDIEMNISFYLKPNEVIEGEKFDKDAFTEKDAVVEPLDNVKVVFYGNDKLVTLENIKNKKSALRTKIIHKTNDGKQKDETISFPILLHIPQNSDTLEIIR